MDPQIHEWQKAILPNQSSEEIIGIAKVFSDCSDLWGALINTIIQQCLVQKNTIRKLESAHSYIHLWADGYDVLTGKFEKRLKNSQRAGDLTIRLLQSICETLAQELTPLVTGISTVTSQDATGLSLAAADLALSAERLAVLVQGDSSSEASEDGESVISSEPISHEKLLEDIADDLRNDTQCLLDLGARFEEQVMNPIASEAAANPSNAFDGEVSDTFIERILRIYPRCESNLAGRMGKANWLRFLRIAGLKAQLSEVRQVPDRDSDTIKDTTESELVEFKSIVASTREKSLFYDSGLGTSSHISGSHLNTIRTTPEAPSCPQLPDGAIQGESFCCMACKNQVTIGSEKEWRAHLLRDIKPYVCPEPSCDASLFTSASQWEWEEHVDCRHPQSTIWSDSSCRICGKATSNRAIVIQHLVDHMEAIALASIPWDAAMEVEKVPVNDTHKKSEGLTSSPKQEYTETLQTASPRAQRGRVRTGCNRCKMRRIKCDEKRPSCESCIKSKAVCDGYPPPPRPREAGADSKVVELPPKPGQAHGSKLESMDSNDQLFDLFLEAVSPTSIPDDNCLESVLGTQDELPGTFNRVFKPPPSPPTPTHRHLPVSANRFNLRGSRDSFKSHSESDPGWDNTTVLGGLESDTYLPYEGSGAAVDTTHTHRRSKDATKMSPNHGVLPRRRDKPLPPIIVDDPSDTIAMKRVRNSLAARKSRERKAQRLEELEEKIAKLEQDRDSWKNIAMQHGAERL